MKLLKRIKHLSDSVQREIVEQLDDLAGAPKVSRQEFERRIRICEGCSLFKAESRRCSLCHCFMDVKAGLKEYPFSLSGDKTVRCAQKDNPRW
jgi:hypothetical protein